MDLPDALAVASEGWRTATDFRDAFARAFAGYLSSDGRPERH